MLQFAHCTNVALYEVNNKRYLFPISHVIQQRSHSLILVFGVLCYLLSADSGFWRVSGWLQGGTAHCCDVGLLHWHQAMFPIPQHPFTAWWESQWPCQVPRSKWMQAITEEKKHSCAENKQWKLLSMDHWWYQPSLCGTQPHWVTKTSWP